MKWDQLDAARIKRPLQPGGLLVVVAGLLGAALQRGSGGGRRCQCL